MVYECWGSHSNSLLGFGPWGSVHILLLHILNKWPQGKICNSLFYALDYKYFALERGCVTIWHFGPQMVAVQNPKFKLSSPWRWHLLRQNGIYVEGRSYLERMRSNPPWERPAKRLLLDGFCIRGKPHKMGRDEIHVFWDQPLFAHQ